MKLNTGLEGVDSFRKDFVQFPSDSHCFTHVELLPTGFVSCANDML